MVQSTTTVIPLSKRDNLFLSFCRYSDVCQIKFTLRLDNCSCAATVELLCGTPDPIRVTACVRLLWNAYADIVLVSVMFG
jgi:hypothetical protein